MSDAKTFLPIQHSEAQPLSQLLRGNGQFRSTMAMCFDSSPVSIFVIDTNHTVVYWNRACEYITGVKADAIIDTQNQWQPFYRNRRPVLSDMVVEGMVEQQCDTYYKGRVRQSKLVVDAYEGEDFFPQLGESGKWLMFSAAPLRNEQGQVIGAIQSFQDVTQRKLAELNLERVKHDLELLIAKRTVQLEQANRNLEEDIRQREAAEAMLIKRNLELTELNENLSRVKEQLMQSEKMASIGQLAAGVAHEINNPIGFVFSNFGTLESYVTHLFQMLAAYEDLERVTPHCAELEHVRTLKQKLELDYLRDDIPQLMHESRDGIVRVRKIVQDLKDFSRVDALSDWQLVNIEDGIMSTLNILGSELRYKADVETEFRDLPDIECHPSQINQVVMNLVANAAQAMTAQRGWIKVGTGYDDEFVWIDVIDNGCGIPRENLSRIFDPFFTTKAVGQGTGLGLWLSYGIVQKHSGRIDVESEPGVGTKFRVILPRTHKAGSSTSA